MSQSSSSTTGQASVDTSRLAPYPRRRWWMAIALPLWVLGGFVASALLIQWLLLALKIARVPLALANQTVLETALAALVYLVALGFVIGLPWLIWRRRVTREDIGLHRLPVWMDIWMTPVGFIVYLIASTLLMLVATQLFPWIDANQVQDTGFGQLNQRYEYILAFVTLVVIAPVAEEILFRGYLFGKLKKFVPIWIAILITSLLFGFVHGAWNLAIDTFALSVVMCLLRQTTGSLWAPILLHMTKNSLAFYLLFINPTLLNTLGG